MIQEASDSEFCQRCKTASPTLRNACSKCGLSRAWNARLTKWDNPIITFVTEKAKELTLLIAALGALGAGAVGMSGWNPFKTADTNETATVEPCGMMGECVKVTLWNKGKARDRIEDISLFVEMVKLDDEKKILEKFKQQIIDYELIFPNPKAPESELAMTKSDFISSTAAELPPQLPRTIEFRSGFGKPFVAESNYGPNNRCTYYFKAKSFDTKEIIGKGQCW